MKIGVLPCDHFPACSGCAGIGTPYAEQLERKLAATGETFDRFGQHGIHADLITGIAASPSQCGYRNRVKLVPARDPADPDRIHLGLFRTGTHDVVDIPGCPVQTDAINRVANAVRELVPRHGLPLYDETTLQGELRFVTIRQSMGAGELLVGLVTCSDTPPALSIIADALMDISGVVGVMHNINPARGNVIFSEDSRVLASRPYIEEQIHDLRIRLGLTSFSQANAAVAGMAYRALLDGLAISADDILLDLYCGVGTIGLLGAGSARQVIGMEEVAEAIAFARESATLNGITNATFATGAVETMLPPSDQDRHGDGVSFAQEASPIALSALQDSEHLLVAVNPPRKGLHAAVIDHLLTMSPRRIAYLSCHPYSLVRDLNRLASGGYRTTRVELFDMFPQTPQVESLALLEPDRPQL